MRTPLLMNMLSQPTAPFREMHVYRVVMKELKKHKVPHFRDPIGNLVVGAKNKAEYIKKVQTRSKEPLRLFIAHTDHPGFHGEKWITNRKLKIKWHGGSPLKHLNNANVWVGNDQGILSTGKIQKAKLHKSKRWMESGEVHFSKPLARNMTKLPPKTLFGAWEFSKPVWKKGKMIYTKAADDLVGAFCIASLGLELSKKDQKNFIGILTRAEEVGFIGTIGHMELNWLRNPKRPLLCTVLEASRTLPGAIVGKGPVVRLGDRITVYDPHYLRALSTLAIKTLKKKHQKRIMDGGACEASAATAYGIPAVGISVPLGNYHNQSFEGGPESRGKDGPAPEFVHEEDVAGMLKLCHALVKTSIAKNPPWAPIRKRFSKLYRNAQKLL